MTHTTNNMSKSDSETTSSRHRKQKRRKRREKQKRSDDDDDYEEVSLNPIDYPSYGIAAPLGSLIDVFGEIHLYSRERQAKYADMIWLQMVARSPKRLKERLQAEDNPEALFTKWNTTAVGNMAYVSLNAKDPELRSLADDILTKYVAWRKWEARRRILEVVVSICIVTGIVGMALYASTLYM